MFTLITRLRSLDCGEFFRHFHLHNFTPHTNGNFFSAKKVPKGNGNDLLWHECAGHTVNVPRISDSACYFPRGHLEHVVALMNVEGNIDVSNNMPSKILCKVVDVRLKADPKTEHLYCNITLLPNNEEYEVGVSTIGSVPENVDMNCFRRILRGREVDKHGGFTLHKQDAIDTFPLLTEEDEAVPASQNLVAKDLHGATWHCQHVYRGTTKRHYLTTGWNKFVNEKGLVARDTCILLRYQNEIYIEVRRAVIRHKQPPRDLPFPDILHGTISDACALINERTDLMVYYYPRGASKFIVVYNEVMESLQVNYSDRMFFEMLSDEGREDGDNGVQTLTGTITDVEIHNGEIHNGDV